ncbi:hypothetical protein HDU78_006732 [Chytriomyces hyalinus]|nr:hypothetical protein HDU78_006732 [Chytriomyces hyalinus]
MPHPAPTISTSQRHVDTLSNPVLVMNLRRLLSSSPPSLPSLEAVFRLYIPITLSPTSVATLKDSDFTLLANYILRTAETHLNMNLQQPAPDTSLQDATDANTTKEEKPYDKAYIFTKLIRETTVTAKVELLASIASMMNHLVEKADKPSSSLPAIFNSFSKLILSDIGRLKPKRLSSNTAIPTLAMLRTISNENEAAVFLTQLDAFIGKRGQRLDDYLFSAVISAFGFSNRADLAFQFYNALNENKDRNSAKMGIATYLSICQVLISANRIDDAVVVAIDMVGTGKVHPKQTTFNGLFRSLLKSEHIDAEKKQILIDKVVDNFWARVASKDDLVLASFRAGTGPYAKFLDILMRHYARSKQYERVITLARRLESQNVSLSVYANNTILNFLFWEGKEELAMMLFDELCGAAKLNQTQYPESNSPHKASINAHTLNIMLAHISKRKGTHSAITFFRTMQQTHPEILPDTISYSTLIHACFKARMPAKAKELHREMISLGLKPNLITCTALMDGLLKNNELTEAMKIFAWFQTPPPSTEEQQQLYEGPPDQIMHTSAIHNLSYTKDSKSHVANAYNKFQELNEPPDIVLFNVLLHYFIRTKQSENTDMMLMDMEHLNLEPDSYTSTAIVYGLIAHGDYKAAEPAALKLIRNNMPITVHAITAVLKGLAKASRPVCMTRWIESFLPNAAKPITQSEAAVQELCTISKWTQKEQVLSEIFENPDCAVLDKLREGCSGEPDFMFYQTCVMGFLRIGAVECADALTRHLLVRGGDVVDLRGPAASHLVERVAKKWNALSDEKRGDDLRKVLKLHQ